MTRTHKLINLAGIALPFVGLVIAVIVLWERMVGPTELAILAVGYLLTGAGITVGYHRLFTHRSFETTRGSLRVRRARGDGGGGRVLALGGRPPEAPRVLRPGGRSAQPAVGYGDGVLGALSGLWHAHRLALLGRRARRAGALREGPAARPRSERDREALPAARALLARSRRPLAGWLLIGGWYGFIAGRFWGGAVRIFLLHHVTFSINSICHFWGRRRFASRTSRGTCGGSRWLSFGESWHNNHHAFPTSAFHGLRRTEIDPGGWLIWLLERAGLAWNVVRIPPDKQAHKLAVH